MLKVIKISTTDSGGSSFKWHIPLQWNFSYSSTSLSSIVSLESWYVWVCVSDCDYQTGQNKKTFLACVECIFCILDKNVKKWRLSLTAFQTPFAYTFTRQTKANRIDEHKLKHFTTATATAADLTLIWRCND